MSESTTERRRSRRRRRVEEHGIAAARVRPGYEVSIIDVSAGGALVESGRRLLPGAVVELQLELSDRRVAIRGRVLRCAVARLRSTSVRYRGAIGFDRHLPWFVEEDSAGYAVPAVEGRPGGPGWVDATRQPL